MGRLILGMDGTEHRAMGRVILEKRESRLFVDECEVVRFLTTSKTGPWTVRGHELRNKMISMPVLNTCMLDTLLEYPEFIPDEWGEGRTYFWGTIHCYKYASFADLCVRYLYRRTGGEWAWKHTPLDYHFGPRAYAAELKQN